LNTGEHGNRRIPYFGAFTAEILPLEGLQKAAPTLPLDLAAFEEVAQRSISAIPSPVNSYISNSEYIRNLCI
jgi:hypothetical protein